MSLQKFLKKSLKWIIFFVISTITAHSFIAYFTGAEELIRMISHPPKENWNDFLFVSSITGILLFNFGWFKEQFCFIMCPYGRFQSILMDNSSLAVMYDENRGEPRKKPDVQKEKQGDCVNCGRCLMVCPTGIDIRRGIQMECINCTACIDACDEIMEKVKKPKGLIRYSTLIEMNQNGKKHFWSFRTALYLTLIIGALSVLTYKVISREHLHMELLRVKGPPYIMLEGVGQGLVMNQFNAHIRNQTHHPMKVNFKIISDDAINPVELIQQDKDIELKPGEIQSHLLFVKFPLALTGGLGQKTVKVRVAFDAGPGLPPNSEELKVSDDRVIEAEMKLLAPFK